MDPDGGDTGRRAGKGRGDGSAKPFVGWPVAAIERRDELLAAGAQQHREAQRHDPVEAGQQRQIVIDHVLAEAYAWIEPDPLAQDARRHCRLRPRGQEIHDLGDHVIVARLCLHRTGLALHVHQHDVAAERGGHRQALGGMAQRRDVVPDRRAGRHSRAGHDGLHGVDGERDPALGADRTDQRDDACDLLILDDRFRAGPGRLTADVENICAVHDQAARLGQGRVGIGETPAIGKAVRRDVQHAHDARGWWRRPHQRLDSKEKGGRIAATARFNRSAVRLRLVRVRPGAR